MSADYGNRRRAAPRPAEQPAELTAAPRSR